MCATRVKRLTSLYISLYPLNRGLDFDLVRISIAGPSNNHVRPGAVSRPVYSVHDVYKICREGPFAARFLEPQVSLEIQRLCRMRPIIVHTCIP